LSLLHGRADHFIFEGGAGHTRKKISSIVFAEEIKIVHNSTKQRNILQASEIKFMRGSPKLLVTKNISAEKKIALPPPPKSKI